MGVAGSHIATERFAFMTLSVCMIPLRSILELVLIQLLRKGISDFQKPGKADRNVDSDAGGHGRIQPDRDKQKWAVVSVM
jgi:hypothetical protein